VARPRAWETLLALWLTASPAVARAECDDPALDAFGRAACEIRATHGAPLCDPIDEGVQRRIARRLERAEGLVTRAGQATGPARIRRLVGRAARQLQAAGRRIVAADDRDRVTPECRAAVETRLALLEDLVALLDDEVPMAPAGLPAYVAGYERWLRLNAEPIPPRPAGDAHFGTKDVYVNRTREDISTGGVQRFPYPDGAIVVKTATRPGADFVHLVAIMRKRRGSDPAHGDWEFVEYARSSAADRFDPIARDGVCWGCHAMARNTSDWVFTLLE
jgi:hypothetical protein